jgi:Co/Zn/Cd efflux system component
MFWCEHNDATCPSRHYRDAGIVLLATLCVQLWLMFRSGSVVVVGDTVHLGSDVVGIAGTFIVLALMLRMYVSEETIQLATLFNILLLLIGGIMVLEESWSRLMAPRSIERGYTLFAGIIGGAGNYLAAQLLGGARRFATQTLSINHKANVLHLRSDMWMSGVVVISAAGSVPFGFRLDAFLGILIAAYVLNEGIGYGYTAWTQKEYPLHLHLGGHVHDHDREHHHH